MENNSHNSEEKKCYYPSLNYSIRDTMTHVKTDSDDEDCQICCYPCSTCTPYVDTTPIIDTTCVPIIWVLGGTHTDKQTQCKMVLEHLYCMVHISVKNMLSSELTSGSRRAEIIKMMIDKGAPVPSELIIEMIKEKILETRTTASGYLITGFPRERQHGYSFEKAIAAPSIIICLKVSFETLLNRNKLHNKRNNRSNPAVEDKELEIQRKKIEIIQKHTKDIIEDYWTKVRYVDGEQSENNICCDILQILEPVISEALAYKNKNPKLNQLFGRS